MSLASVCAMIEAENRRIVEYQTWGHMAPKPQVIYPGHVLFTHGIYGDITVIESEFPGLDDSPWFYRSLHNYVGDYIVKQDRTGVWRFDGYCKMTKGGVIRFSGKIRPMRVQYRFQGKSK